MNIQGINLKKREYIAFASIILVITAGNYLLSGGSKSNWVAATDYGFTLLHPPGIQVWSTGLDDDHVFDIYGNHRASSDSGMMGFNLDGTEFAVTWVTFNEASSFEDILAVHYHSCEVNAIKRDRGFDITLEPMTFGELNGHEVAYQVHTLELDMPDMDTLLYAKGAVAGWTCEETGVSYVSYLLFWRNGQPPIRGDNQLRSALNKYLETLECH